jgi:hypothetical protein
MSAIFSSNNASSRSGNITDLYFWTPEQSPSSFANIVKPEAEFVRSANSEDDNRRR